MWLQLHRELNGSMKWAVGWEAWDNEWQFGTEGKPTYPGHVKRDIRSEIKRCLLERGGLAVTIADVPAESCDLALPPFPNV